MTSLAERYERVSDPPGMNSIKDTYPINGWTLDSASLSPINSLHSLNSIRDLQVRSEEIFVI